MTQSCLGKWLHSFVSVHHVPVCVYMCVGALHDQKVASGPLELEVQELVRCPGWVLGTTLRPSLRTGCSLNHWAISLAHRFPIILLQMTWVINMPLILVVVSGRAIFISRFYSGHRGVLMVTGLRTFSCLARLLWRQEFILTRLLSAKDLCA